MSIWDKIKSKRKETAEQLSQLSKPKDIKAEPKPDEPPPVSSEPHEPPAVKKGGREAYKVLLNPLVTEKTALQNALGKYTFSVPLKTNKILIRKAVKELFGVSPIRVNLVHLKGKLVRFGRTQGKRSDIKKAVITLKKGETIDVNK
ncbi:MAG: 50S ribosomal protein L23 [Parcubacteria group bacterium]|nr:50S ribosomal protein L23 [Parcubacteria group bacterium]